jgi:hypothetical protein
MPIKAGGSILFTILRRILEMGTPNSMPSRLDVVLGDVKCKLSTEEWIILIEKLLVKFKPYLKYLESSMPLGCDFKDRGGFHSRRRFPVNAGVFWPLGEGFNKETRVIRLGRVITDESEPKDWSGKRRSQVTEVSVYLTRDTELIFIQTKFWHFVIPGVPGRKEDEVFEVKAFPMVSLSANMNYLRLLIDQNERTGPAIVDNLINALNQNIGPKEQRLESLRELRNYMKGVQGRLE